MKILATIVLYNPDIERLIQNIEAIHGQVDELILIDNGSTNINEVKSEVKYSVKYLINKKNVGIAKALNEGFEYAIEHNFDWVLTLDQDSVCDKNLIQTYKKYLQLPDIGMLTCNFKDRNDVNGKTILEEEQDSEYYTVSRCITSASFCSVEAYKKSGGFDNEMFIDFVDYDYSTKMYINGYKIYRINYNGLLHEIGHKKIYKFLGRKLVSSNHSPFRQYYMARNPIIMVKKYPDYYKMSERIRAELGQFFVILVYEKNKWKKISRRCAGIIDGLRYKVK